MDRSGRAASSERRLDLGVLDALRGLAALYVVLYHTKDFLWDKSASVAPRGFDAGAALAWLWPALTQYGQDAVLLFFVLSGFCIHYRQAKRAAADPRTRQAFDVRDFAWRRFRRLYPVLLVALAATAALDFVGVAINPGFYDGSTPYAFMTDLVQRSYSAPTLIGNLLLQPTLAVPAFGTNHPLWSLAYEFWFYALYPVFLVILARVGPARSLPLTLGVSVLALTVVRVGALSVPVWVGAVLGHWAVWIAGALVAEMYVGRVRIPGLRFVALFGALTIVVVMAVRPNGGPGAASWADLAAGLGLSAVLAWTMLSSPSSAVGRTVETVSRWCAPLGSISYSLYVIHLPWVVFLSALWLASRQALPVGGELMVVGVVSSLGLAAVCWWAVERHFISSRQKRAAGPAAVAVGADPATAQSVAA